MGKEQAKKRVWKAPKNRLPAVEVVGENVAKTPRKKRLIRRPGDTCAEIVTEKKEGGK